MQLSHFFTATKTCPADNYNVINQILQKNATEKRPKRVNVILQ